MQKLGRFDALAARMEKNQVQPVWHAPKPISHPDLGSVTIS
jgi:hypothetical protein